MGTKNTDPVDVHIGGRIRLARIAMSMSQERLGDHLGMTFQQIQKYEKGTNRVAGSRLWAISKALEVAPAYFFEGLEQDEGDMRTPEAVNAVENFLRSREGVDLAIQFDAIESGPVRRAVLDLVGTLQYTNDETG